MKKAPLIFALALTIILIACGSVEPELAVGENTAVSPTTHPTQAATETPPASATPILPTPTTANDLPRSTPDIVPLETTPTYTPTPFVEPTPAIALGQPQLVGRGQILDAAFSSDGSSAAIAWATGVSLIETADASEQWYQPLPAAPIALDLRGDNGEIAVSLASGEVVLLNVADGGMQMFPVASDNVYWGDIAYAPDGSQLAVQNIGPRRADPIFLLDTANGAVTELPNSDGNEGTQPYLVWSPDGQFITLSKLGEDCTTILNATTGEPQFVLTHDEGCYASFVVAWSPNGRFLAVDTGTNEIDLIEFATQNVVQTITGSTQTFGPSAVGAGLFFSPDGSQLISRGGLGFYNDSFNMLVWDVATGEKIGELTAPINQQRLVSRYTTDGTIVSLYGNGAIGRWTVGESSETFVSEQPVLPIRFPFVLSPDGGKIAARTDTQFAVWDVATGQPQLVFDKLYQAPSFSPNGRLLTLYHRDTETLDLVDLTQGEIVQTLTNVSAAVEHSFSPNGRLLIYGSGSDAVVYDVENGSELARLTGYPASQRLAKVVWSPTMNGVLVGAGPADGGEIPGAMILWRLQENDFTELFRAENVRTGYGSFAATVAKFNPSGTHIAIENVPINDANEFTIFVYDMAQEEVVLEFSEHRLSAWIDDETLLTSQAQFDIVFTKWDVATGRSTAGGGFDSGGNAYAPVGGFYAAQDSGGRNIGRGVDLRSWDSQETIFNYPMRGDLILVQWADNGRILAASDTLGLAYVWPVQYAE